MLFRRRAGRAIVPTANDGDADAAGAAAGAAGGEPDSGLTLAAAVPDVRVVNMHKTYLLGTNGVAALRGVSIDVQPGEFVAVYGPSGSGKSTLLSVIGTIDRHSKGDLYLFGDRVSSSSADSSLAARRLLDIGFVFQAFNLLPTLNAFENVELPLVLAGVPKADRTKRVDTLLRSVGMSHRAKNLPAQLSGGEQQRVTIARALANRPRLLLLDEPTGDLDTANTDVIMHLLIELHERYRVTMVMVTHDMSLRSYADRIVSFTDGKIFDDYLVSVHEKNSMRALLREHVSSLRQSSGSIQGVGAVGGNAEEKSAADVDRRDAAFDEVVTQSDGRTPAHDAPTPLHLCEVRQPSDYLAVAAGAKLRAANADLWRPSQDDAVGLS